MKKKEKRELISSIVKNIGDMVNNKVSEVRGHHGEVDYFRNYYRSQSLLEKDLEKLLEL